MTDEELVKRLRSYAKDQGGWHNIDDTCEEAADRIEALTAKVKLMDDLDVINGEKIEALTAKLAEAEAKLEKTVEALEVIRDRQYYLLGAGITAQVIARATLAEIEGEKE
jgi:hypothetical protein